MYVRETLITIHENKLGKLDICVKIKHWCVRIDLGAYL